MKIEFSFEDQDRARLDRLIELLESYQPDTKAAEPVEIPAAPEKSAETPAPAITLDEVRAKAMKLITRDEATKAKVKTALNKYAESIPTIPPEHYADFLADLEVL